MCHECLFVWIDIDQAIPACNRKYVSASYVCPAGWLVLALAVRSQIFRVVQVWCLDRNVGHNLWPLLMCGSIRLISKQENMCVSDKAEVCV